MRFRCSCRTKLFKTTNNTLVAVFRKSITGDIKIKKAVSCLKVIVIITYSNYNIHKCSKI